MKRSATVQSPKRRNIPPTIRQMVLLEAGYKCASPSCRHILTLELHHIVWVKDGGGDEADNLLVLCPNCHSLHTAGHIPADAIRVWKSLLVSLNSPHRASADLLLILHQDEQRIEPCTNENGAAPAFRFTGDGLAMLSGLLVSGLIEISRRFSGLGFYGSSMPSFEVRLTDAGRRLVEAWLSGQPDAIADALSSTL
jgi:hypothetical protein